MNDLIFFFNQAIIGGAVLGSIYALGAVGVTLIFGILRFAHFAHGDMMTLGGFIAFVLAGVVAGMGIAFPLPVGFIVVPFAMLIAAGLALGIDKGFYAPLRARGAKPVTLLIASIGVTMMIQGLIRLFFGVGTYSFFDTQPKVLHRIELPFEGVTRPISFSEPQLLLVLSTIVAVVALHYFLTRSRLGKGMRAMADNPDLAKVSGINTKLVVRVTWIIAGALACLAGTMLALDVSLKPDLAFNIVLPIFAAAILGGLGHAYGAIAGGFVLGFAETLAVFNWAVLLRPFRDNLPDWFEIPNTLLLVQSEYKLTVAFVILVVVLLVRPTGIFQGSQHVMNAMTTRYIAAFLVLFLLIVGVGLMMGSAFTVRLLVEAFAFALIAMGLNIQWGFGGLFNFGILGMLMVGGFAVTFVSYPVNMEFWGSEGPLYLGRTLLAAAIGAVLIFFAHRVQRFGITGKGRATTIVIAWFIAYVIFRSQMDPAASYITSTAGWIGGLGLPVLLGWAFGGVLAGLMGWLIGKVSLGLRADYLAIATIGIAEILRAVLKNLEWLTRGTLTVSPIPWPVWTPQIYQANGADITTSFILARGGFLAVVVIIVLIALFLIHRAYLGPWGRMNRAIRDNYIAAGSMGKDVTGRQLEIFVFGSVLMGIGGAILVSFVGIYDPSSYQPINHTFIIWVMLIVGGAGNNFGALFGGIFIYIVWMLSEPLAQALFNSLSRFSSDMGWGAIPDIASRAVQMRVFVMGLVVTIALRFAPKGLLPEVIRRKD